MQSNFTVTHHTERVASVGHFVKSCGGAVDCGEEHKGGQYGSAGAPFLSPFLTKA